MRTNNQFFEYDDDGGRRQTAQAQVNTIDTQLRKQFRRLNKARHRSEQASQLYWAMSNELSRWHCDTCQSRSIDELEQRIQAKRAELKLK